MKQFLSISAFAIFSASLILVFGEGLQLLDMRNLAESVGIHTLHEPWAYCFFAPLYDFGRSVAASPDPKDALIVCMLYLLALGIVALALRKRGRLLLRGVGLATFFFCLAVALVALFPLSPLRMESSDADIMYVDVQSHTYYSHDGVARPEDNLRFHLDRGYHAWAVTEHHNIDGALALRALAEQASPESIVLIGDELRGWPIAHYLAIGLDYAPSPWAFKTWQRSAMAGIRRRDAALLAVKWWHTEAKANEEHRAFLRPESLLKAGLTGFEFINSGSWSASEEQRQAMLQSGALHHWAGTDWHGWGNFNDVWTAVRIDHRLSKMEREAALLALLRGAPGEVVPLAARPHRLEWPLALEPFQLMISTVRSSRPAAAAAWFAFLLLAGFLLHWPRPLFPQLAMLFSALLFGRGLHFGLRALDAPAQNKILATLSNTLLGSACLLLVAGYAGMVYIRRLQKTPPNEAHPK